MLTPRLHRSLFTYSYIIITAIIIVTMVLRNSEVAPQPASLAFILAVWLRACDDGEVTQ